VAVNGARVCSTCNYVIALKVEEELEFHTEGINCAAQYLTTGNRRAKLKPLKVIMSFWPKP